MTTSDLQDTHVLACNPAAFAWIEDAVLPELRHLVTADSGDFGLLHLLRKPDRLSLLLDPEAEIGDTDLQALLPLVWPGVEAPYQWEYQNLLALFRRTGFITDEAKQARPTGALTIYGGVASQRYRSGISWTTSREQAHWFSFRYAFTGRGVVYAGSVKPEHILGMFGSRDETEIVVDPLTVRGIKAIERRGGAVLQGQDGRPASSHRAVPVWGSDARSR